MRASGLAKRSSRVASRGAVLTRSKVARRARAPHDASRAERRADPVAHVARARPRAAGARHLLAEDAAETGVAIARSTIDLGARSAGAIDERAHPAATAHLAMTSETIEPPLRRARRERVGSRIAERDIELATSIEDRTPYTAACARAVERKPIAHDRTWRVAGAVQARSAIAGRAHVARARIAAAVRRCARREHEHHKRGEPRPSHARRMGLARSARS